MRPSALPMSFFTLLSPRFHQSELVETFCGLNVADYFPERNNVCYLRDTCVVAIEESSSPVKPHRTLSDKVVHGLIVHRTARTYLRYALWFVLVQVIVQLTVTGEVILYNNYR